MKDAEKANLQNFKNNLINDNIKLNFGRVLTPQIKVLKEHLTITINDIKKVQL